MKKKAIEMAKKIIREKYRECQRCGHKSADGFQMQGAHIVPENYVATAADTENILCLCAGCHKTSPNSWHNNPVLYGRWFDEKFPGRYDKLWNRAIQYSRNPKPKIDWQKKYEELANYYEKVYK